MRVLLAGATGAVGRPLLARLTEAGHDVVAMTSRPDRAAGLAAAGAEPLVCDALDTARLRAAVVAARPEVVIDMMTRLPQRIRPRGLRRFYREQNRLKAVGCAALLEAAREAGARRHVSQSVAFLYRPAGTGLRTEADPAWTDAPEPFGRAARVAAAHDARVAAAEDIEGVVLRFGFFYGPGTHLAPGGWVAEDVLRRRLPLAGRGEATWSFVHTADAAAAAVLAAGDAPPGIYNVVDDEPAPMAEWLPRLAELLGAPPPRRVPRLAVRLVAGPATAASATVLEGASNERARRVLGWEPRRPTWREGFAEEAAGLRR